MPEVADFEYCPKCHHYVVMPCKCEAAPLNEDVVAPAPAAAPAPKKGKKAAAAAAASEVTEELNVVPADDATDAK